MRLTALSLSAILLSGCSWFGGTASHDKGYQYKSNVYANQAYSGQLRGAQDPCVVYSPVQPVPLGCDPARVKMAGSHNNSGLTSGTYATGGYGSHAQNARNAGGHAVHPNRVRKPKLRGTISFGTEKSVQGDLFDFQKTGVASGLAYDPTPFIEGSTVAVPNLTTTTTYTSAVEGIDAANVSFNDVYKSPYALKGGLEYIVSPKVTVFANAGYQHTVAQDGSRAAVQSTLLRTISEQPTDDMGAPVGAPLVNTTFIPNQNVANILYDFSDQRKFDLELGARHYFNPVSSDGFRTLTPFVGASAGVSHVNAVTFKTEQNQLFLERAFEGGEEVFYDVPGTPTVTTLYDADWLANGSLTAGMEWQVTPGTAIAVESGVKVYQSRDYATGESGDMNVSVPLTLRGSFNF